MIISNYLTFISEFKRNKDNFYLIHYSCESLNDENRGFVPRITSIAVMHYSTKETKSFSVHLIADELKIDKKDVWMKFEKIEAKLLKDFYNFVSDKKEAIWIHWNMKSAIYGFEHIEHRYKILLGSVPDNAIRAENKVNLSSILWDKYGNYAKKPQMLHLMKMNGGIHRAFLRGDEEVEAFENGEFMKMHKSTTCKVEFFVRVIEKMMKEGLKTRNKLWVKILSLKKIKWIAIIIGTYYRMSYF